MRYVATVIAILAGLGVPATLAAEDLPAAMILEVDGAAPPGVEEFAPIKAGAAYVLPKATTVAFNHLALCQTVRVKGGILIVNEEDFSNPDGEVLSTEKAECPQKIALKSEGVVGGVRLRAFETKPKDIRRTLPVRPVIFLRGKKASSVGRIEIRQGDKVLVKLPVSRDPVVWPSKVAPLAHDTTYVIKLAGKKAGRISETRVRTVARNANRKSPVVVLSVE